jgi:hypothetical protein
MELAGNVANPPISIEAAGYLLAVEKSLVKAKVVTGNPLLRTENGIW